MIPVCSYIPQSHRKKSFCGSLRTSNDPRDHLSLFSASKWTTIYLVPRMISSAVYEADWNICTSNRLYTFGVYILLACFSIGPPLFSRTLPWEHKKGSDQQSCPGEQNDFISEIRTPPAQVNKRQR
jgi:hypothetical protein